MKALDVTQKSEKGVTREPGKDLSTYDTSYKSTPDCVSQ